MEALKLENRCVTKITAYAAAHTSQNNNKHIILALGQSNLSRFVQRAFTRVHTKNSKSRLAVLTSVKESIQCCFSVETSFKVSPGECQFELGRLYLVLDTVDTPNLDLVVHWYKEAINNNVSKYQLPLTIALIYLFGGDGIKNETEALEWIEKAAENNPRCYTVVGDAYYAGGVDFENELGLSSIMAGAYTPPESLLSYSDTDVCYLIRRKFVGRNYAKALEWYLKAAKALPNKDAPVTKIALIYFQGGDGVEKDYQKALDWSENLRDEDYELTRDSIAIILTIYREGGFGVEKDAEKALNYCLLNQEYPFNFEAGEICQFYMYPPDFKKAALYYEKCRILDKRANGRRGYLYLKGLGVRKNFPYAKKLFGENSYYKGYFLHYGIDTDIDYDLAQIYYEKCISENGFYGKSLNQLGLLHQVKSKDFKKAIDFFKRAAHRNCYDAFNNLGDVYKYGYGVDVNYEEAFKWYSKAAKKPADNEGQFNLAVMYSEGKGTQVDYKLALHWFEKAKNYGNEKVSPVLLSQTRTLFEYSEKISSLEAQLKNNHIDVQVPQIRELPKMFYVEDKRR
ncbi:unnamed protein product [Mucor hiemalis]